MADRPAESGSGGARRRPAGPRPRHLLALWNASRNRAGRRHLVVVSAIGSLTAAAGAVAIWGSGAPDEVSDAGRRPGFGATAVIGRDGRHAQRKPGLPVALSVPAVRLRAAILPAGIDRTGAMELPDDVSRVGWYRYGPRPGSATGSAVLAGHVDSRARGVGVLASLRRVSPGDRLSVYLADGRVVNYRTVAREVMTKRAMPLGDLFARAGRPRLTVITCGGPFDAHLGRYRDNLVITAVPG